MRTIADVVGGRFEWMSRQEIAEFQGAALKTSVARAARSPYYAAKFKELGIDPDDIRSAADVTRLPFTTKEDLRLGYPDRMLTVDPERVVRLHTSSGTTGKPTAIMHTQPDIDCWAELMARCLAMTGATSKDVFQNMSGYGMFTGGLGLHYGAERLGMMVIPSGPGQTARQIMLIRDFGVTCIHATPSYFMHVAEKMVQDGDDPKALGIKRAFCGAEPYTEELRVKLEDLYGCKVYNSYGLSEMMGPGVAFECTCQDGMHIWEDAYLFEIIDPDTLEPTREGEVGELVMTTLRREAMPIMRYRTRDLTSIIPGDCACGRKHARLAWFVGRSDDMLIVGGVNVFPSQIEEVIMRNEWLGGNYVIHLAKQGALDKMTVKVEIAQSAFDGSLDNIRTKRDEVAHQIKDQVGFTVTVEVVEPGALPQSEGKAKRVIDER